MLKTIGQQARFGKIVLQEKQRAYDTLYDKLQQLGTPHITGLDQADKQQVFNCIKDRTGMFLTQDEHVLYVETEEEFEKPKFKFTGEAKEALRNYYDSVHDLCTAQTNFAKATQELESKIEDKTVFLSIIQQVQLPAVQIHVRTVEEIKQLEGKTYRELTLSQHLPNAKKKASQSACIKDFKCQAQEGIAVCMHQGLQVSGYPVQETGDREKTTWRPRQGERTKKQEDAGRNRRTRRWHTGKQPRRSTRTQQHLQHSPNPSKAEVRKAEGKAVRH